MCCSGSPHRGAAPGRGGWQQHPHDVSGRHRWMDGELELGLVEQNCSFGTDCHDRRRYVAVSLQHTTTSDSSVPHQIGSHLRRTDHSNRQRRLEGLLVHVRPRERHQCDFGSEPRQHGHPAAERDGARRRARPHPVLRHVPAPDQRHAARVRNEQRHGRRGRCVRPAPGRHAGFVWVRGGCSSGDLYFRE